MNKKLWIGLGAAITTVSPIVAVVACGNETLSKEVQTKNLNKAVADVKKFKMSTKTIAEIKADALTEGKVLKESDVTGNGITLPKLPKGINRRMIVKRGLSEISNTFAIDIELSSKINKKVLSITIMAKDGGVNKIDPSKLASSKSGLINLPWEEPGNGLSLKKVIIDLSDQRMGHLGRLLSGFLGDAYKTVVDFVSMTEFKTVIKLLQGGLSSFDYEDIKGVKAMISKLFGNKYTGDIKILDALINGVKGESSINGKLVELPKIFTEWVLNLIPELASKSDSSTFTSVSGSIKPIIKPLTSRLFGSWDFFLTNVGKKTKIKDLKYSKMTPSSWGTLEEMSLAKVVDLNNVMKYYENFFKNVKKIMITKIKSQKNSNENITFASYLQNLPEFSANKDAFKILDLKDNENFANINKDNVYEFLKLLNSLQLYFTKNWNDILSNKFNNSNGTNPIGEVIDNYIKVVIGDDKITSRDQYGEYIIGLFKIMQFKKSGSKDDGKFTEIATLLEYDENNVKYESVLKAAIKRNYDILGNDIMSVPMLSGKSILGQQSELEFKKTLAYLQSIIQKLVLYLNYENQSNEPDGDGYKASTASLRNILALIKNLTGDIAYKILGSEALLKLATFDITKPISKDMFEENDFNLLSNLFNMLISKSDDSKFTGKNLQSIFKVLIDGFKPTNITTPDFKAAIAKVIKMIPGVKPILAEMLPKILFGIK